MGPNGDVRIDVAKKSDLSGVVELRHTFDRLHEFPGEGGRRENLARFRDMSHQRDARLFVAEQSSLGIVGYLGGLILVCAHQETRTRDTDLPMVFMSFRKMGELYFPLSS
jgi:hypothetical protein